MSILINRDTTVLIQGITGREGGERARLMKEYGTNVVAGITPGKGGESVYGIPVFNTVKEAIRSVGSIQASVPFVPAPMVKGALSEAIDAGIELVIVPTDRMPVHDLLEILALARRKGTRVIGPNTLGMISPEECLVGMIGGSSESAHRFFRKGPVGVMSRSGGMTTTICYLLTREGIGQSTVISIGGDAIVGSTFSDLLPLFEEDQETKCVALFGEIGTTQEERVADLMYNRKFTKPLIAFIAGVSAQEGVRFSHSGAMVTGQSGTAQAKRKRLGEVGAIVIDHVTDFPEAISSMLKKD